MTYEGGGAWSNLVASSEFGAKDRVLNLIDRVA